MLQIERVKFTYSLNIFKNVTILIYVVCTTAGPFSFNELSGIGYIATKQSSDPSWPDIEFHQSPLGLRKTIADDFTAVFGTKPAVLRELFSPFLGYDANFVMVDLGRPKSVGEIRLQTPDPFASPLINPKYYSNSSDVKAMVEGMHYYYITLCLCHENNLSITLLYSFAIPRQNV
jgi:choline dehydrogenase-like flavoprotein